jgi:hypothetical protein
MANYGFYNIMRFPVSPHTTDEFYDPVVMYNGRKIALVKDKKPNFAKSRRFSNYDQDARRLGGKVGPGSYENTYLSISPQRFKTTPLFCRFHNTGNKWYSGSNMRRNIIKQSNN